VAIMTNEIRGGASPDFETWEAQQEGEGEMPEFETSLETEALSEAAGDAWRTESLEFDPYAHIRSAMSPEHASLETNEITPLLGSVPATLALHHLIHSPQMRQATMAGLLGRGARRSVRVNGLDVSIPVYLRVVSRLCREVAEEHENQIPPPASPVLRGVLKYPNDGSRQNYYTFFQAAIQGVAGKTKLSAKQKAELAEKLADASMDRFKVHVAQINCALDSAGDSDSRTKLTTALNLSGPWGDSFKGALQTTSGSDYKSPAQPVKEAADIADQAILASGQLDDSLWNLFMKCKKA
jgi:hypothetical protein